MRKITQTWFVALLALAGCQAARAGVDGSGVRKDEKRALVGFDSVAVRSALSADIVSGAGFEVVVSGDDNLLPLVSTEVVGGRLQITTKQGLSPKAGLTITVKLPALKALEVSGASRVKATGVAGDKLQLETSGASRLELAARTSTLVADVSGASRVDLTGQVGALQLDVSGASRVGAANLDVDSAKLDVSGASRLELRAKKTVTGDASGASRVEVRGPATVDVESSGASSVNHRS
jgi:hypothetical protein